MISRAYKAGIALADSIVEMGNLYDNKRARANFYRGLVERLEEQREK